LAEVLLGGCRPWVASKEPWASAKKVLLVLFSTAKGTGRGPAADLALLFEQRPGPWGLVSCGGHRYETALQEGEAATGLTVMTMPSNP